jgi:hypothetical protein
MEAQPENARVRATGPHRVNHRAASSASILSLACPNKHIRIECERASENWQSVRTVFVSPKIRSLCEGLTSGFGVGYSHGTRKCTILPSCLELPLLLAEEPLLCCFPLLGYSLHLSFCRPLSLLSLLLRFLLCAFMFAALNILFFLQSLYLSLLSSSINFMHAKHVIFWCQNEWYMVVNEWLLCCSSFLRW